MKYSSTTRLINVIVLAVLAFGFGFLGIYFGILATPYLLTGVDGPLGVSFSNVSWGLFGMLGVFGLAGLFVSAYGLVQAILSVIRGNDDAPVRRSFSSYVAIGYLIAFFFLVNAVWLYRLTSTNIGYDDIAFVIIVYVILFLIAIIVSNIPLLRMYGEGEEFNKIMKVITGPIVATSAALVLVYGISYLVLAGAGDVYARGTFLRILGVPSLIFIVALVLSCLAFLGYQRADKANVVRKGNGLLFEGSLLALGAAVIVAGVFEYLNEAPKAKAQVSLVAKTVPNYNGNYMEFSVMSWIFGGIIVLLALALIVSTLKGKNEKK